ncbi:unnamed protein product [Rotaria socialis]|uniref:Uncharacterized protein n=1 Tax=Rotaria socialis TaxID=392032 RepID=A0A818CV59_9BILA|nr:unnamed protein product [Rotaria socialis]CAF4747241.1 unnamed protein product [Rotaria socialis]
MKTAHVVILLLVCFNCLTLIHAFSLCQEGSMFPDWMIGNFHAQFADGSSANGSFGLWYANVTFSTGDYGRLTMTSPLHKGDGFYVFHECVHINGVEPQHRCSLLVRNPIGGYTEYIHKDPKLVPLCPKSLVSLDLEIEIVTKIN